MKKASLHTWTQLLSMVESMDGLTFVGKEIRQSQRIVLPDIGQHRAIA